MAYIFSFYADDIKLLKDKTSALGARNCDGLFNLGFRTNGVYDLVFRKSTLPMFCEFGRGGYNWLVSKQSILLYELAMMFFLN